jgi:uncharacterized protein (TIGR00661 family)
MNIVYGVSGEGLGHVFEAIEIVALLERQGHTVRVLTYGDRAYNALKTFHPTRIEGIHLFFNSRGLSLFDTVFRNARCIPFYFKHGMRLKRELAAFRPDVFITAYEPFSMLVSHFLRRPLISMDNQNELLHLREKPTCDRPGFWLAKLATRVCTFGAAYYIIKSYGRAKTDRKNVRFVSPIVQNEIRKLDPSYGTHVLAYLTKPNPGLVELFKSLDETFIVYCHNRVGEEGNITYRASGPCFLRDLSTCKAIVGTTGFSLIADSIFLKKPYFGVPLKGQFEQTLNAFFLRASQLGEYSEDASRHELERFFRDLPKYRERLSRYHLDPAEQEETLVKLLAELEQGRAPEAIAACPGP